MHQPAFDETWWKEQLHTASLRATPTRLAVLRALSESPTPLSALEVLKAAGPAAAGADRVTVYRTLNSLVEAALAHRVDPGDRTWRYGLLNVAHGRHAHFVCDACGVVRCVEDAEIDVSFSAGSGREKFKVKQPDVYLHGICASCTEPEDTPPAPRPKSKR